MIHRIEPFFPTWLVKIEPFFSTWLKELNPFLKTCLIKIVFLQKIFKELNLLLSMTQRIEPFRTWLQKLNFFWTWFTEMNLFSALLEGWNIWEYDSKNWTFLIWLKELNLLFYMTQRIELFFCENLCFFPKNHKFEPFSTWLKELNLLFYMTSRTELFLLEELNFFFSNLNQRIDFFKNFTSNYWPFFEYDSQNWTLLTRLKDLRTFLHESKNSNTFLK